MTTEHLMKPADLWNSPTTWQARVAFLQSFGFDVKEAHKPWKKISSAVKQSWKWHGNEYFTEPTARVDTKGNIELIIPQNVIDDHMKQSRLFADMLGLDFDAMFPKQK